MAAGGCARRLHAANTAIDNRAAQRQVLTSTSAPMLHDLAAALLTVYLGATR
jgi:hypothetical protein